MDEAPSNEAIPPIDLNENALTVRKFYVGDEICRLLPEGPLFGQLVERTVDNSFVVKWHTTPSTTEEGFNPYQGRVCVVNRKLQVGEHVLVGALGQKGRVTKVLEAATLLIPRTSRAILDAPLSKVQPFVDNYIGEPIFYNGWFGQITWVDWWVILDFGWKCHGGTSTTTNSSLLKRYHSASSQIQDKSIPPHKGQTFKTSEIDLSLVKWITTGILFPVLGATALSSHAVVTDIQVSEVSVNWLTPVSEASGQKPAPNLTGVQLKDAVALDHFKRHWLALNTLCSYTIQQDDRIVHFNNIRKTFLEEHFGDSDSDSHEPLAKRRKNDLDAVKREIEGESVEVVVHSVRQTVKVVLENGNVMEYLSSSILQRDNFIAENNIPVLEFVQFNKFEGLQDTCAFSFQDFSLVLSKDMSSEIFVVRKFTSGSWENTPIPIGPEEEIPKYDLVPHERYGNLRRGEIVVRSPHHPNLDFQVGVIREITESGRLKVFCGETRTIRPLWPFEVELFGKSNWTWKFLPTQSPSLPFHSKKQESLVSEKTVIRQSSTTFTSALLRWNTAITAGLNALTSNGEPSDSAPPSETEEVPETLEVLSEIPEQVKKETPLPSSYLVVQNYFHETNLYGVKVSRDIQELQAGNLPPGIALKKDPLRFDLWTALIQGPSGTPYEDGLFIFDILLDVDYPYGPPKIHFRPPSLAKLSPNLKRDGTVCLSIFNNWPGAMQWDSQLSLVEFLIRIRDTIFVPEPYYNKRKLFDTREVLLNKNTYCNNARIYNTSVCVAVLDSLLVLKKRPPRIWRKEIIAYTRCRAHRITSRLRNWITPSENHTSCSGEIFHLFPLSAGFLQAIPRRIEAFDLESDEHRDEGLVYAFAFDTLPICCPNMGFEPLA